MALDAAATAAEGISDPNLRAAVSLLQDELDAYYERTGTSKDFQEQQIAAVKELAEHPERFA